MTNIDINSYRKQVVDTIQDEVMVVSPDGVVASVNSAFEEVTGYNRHEIVGRQPVRNSASARYFPYQCPEPNEKIQYQ